MTLQESFTVKSGIRIATADGRWFVHRLHGISLADELKRRGLSR